MNAQGQRVSDRNFWLGVSNGVLITGGEAFFHSGLVLAPFLAALGAPAWAIGLIPAMRVGGWFLPQILVATRLAHLPYKLPLYWRTSSLRIAVFTLMTAAVFVVGDRPGLLVAITLSMVLVNAVAGGVGGVPFADVTAKVVPHARLGTFWTLRNGIGGGLALLAGLVLRAVLESDMVFPNDFGLLFIFGTALSAGAYLSFALVREPPGKTAPKARMRSTLQRLPLVLRGDPSFQRYLNVRFLGLAALAAEPFYAIYAIERLGAPPSALGSFVIVATVAAIGSNFFVRRAADGGRNVDVLRWSLVLLLLAPLLAFAFSDWRWYALVFAAAAAGNSMMGIAAWNLLYAIAPEADRPLYVGVANSVLAVPSFMPVALGAALAWMGYGWAFALAGAMALFALLVAWNFAELRSFDRAALEGRHR